MKYFLVFMVFIPVFCVREEFLLLALFLLFTTKIPYLTYLLVGLLLINIMAPPLGQLVQRYITTSPDVTGLYIYYVVVSPARTHPLLGLLFYEYKVNIGKYTMANKPKLPKKASIFLLTQGLR